MFEVQDVKLFKDVVHGYISIPTVMVKQIIDTPLFQRLRYIQQTNMQIVYSSATHDRFTHTLGVYHLGCQAVDRLLDSFRDDHQHAWNIDTNPTKNQKFWAKNKYLFLMACLFHDLGHSPFSHALEHFYLSDMGGPADINEKLRISFPKEISGSTIAAHEKISALLVLNNLREAIKNVLQKLPVTYSDSQSHYLYEESEFDEDVLFIARIIMGLKYPNYERPKQVLNSFISLLNNVTFDVDKLDYIIRDTQMSGLHNINLDIKRLLGSLTVTPKTVYKNYSFSGEEFSEEKVYILESQFSTPETDVVQGSKEEQIELDGDVTGEITLVNFDLTLKTGAVCSMPITNVRVGGAKVTAFEFRDTQLESDLNLKNEPDCPSIKLERIKGQATANCDNIRFKSAYFKGYLKGRLDLAVLGNKLVEGEGPSKNKYLSYEVGFKKQALSAIQNVVSARNYLYIWIYAHHKVVYYSHYLLPALLEEAVKICYPGLGVFSLISWNTFCADGTSHIKYINDTDVLSLFKKARSQYEEMEPETQSHHKAFVVLYEEFFGRNYKSSLYKSLQEFDLCLIDINSADKRRLLQEIRTATGEQEANYGTWESQDLLNEIGVETLIWVDPMCSFKNFDIENTFMVIDGEPVNLKNMQLFQNSASIFDSENYFYIYYKLLVGGDKKDISKRLLGYFKRLLQIKN